MAKCNVYLNLYLHINHFRNNLKKNYNNDLYTLNGKSSTLYNYFNNNIRYPMKYLGDHLLHSENKNILKILEEIDSAFTSFLKIYVNQEDSKHVFKLMLKIHQLYLLAKTLETNNNLSVVISNLDKESFLHYLQIKEDDGSFYLLEYK